MSHPDAYVVLIVGLGLGMIIGRWTAPIRVAPPTTDNTVSDWVVTSSYENEFGGLQTLRMVLPRDCSSIAVENGRLVVERQVHTDRKAVA